MNLVNFVVQLGFIPIQAEKNKNTETITEPIEKYFRDKLY